MNGPEKGATYCHQLHITGSHPAGNIEGQKTEQSHARTNSGRYKASDAGQPCMSGDADHQANDHQNIRYQAVVHIGDNSDCQQRQ